MFRIQKTIGFDAAHHLVGLPSTHKCANVHGHSYVVEVVLTGETLDEVGFLTDFGTVKKVVHGTFDHKDINAVFAEMGVKDNPTAEVLARIITEMLSQLFLETECNDEVKVESVKVFETASSWAEYRCV